MAIPAGEKQSIDPTKELIMGELALAEQEASSSKRVTEQLKDIELVKIFFTDLNGRLKNLDINPNNVMDILNHGIGIDGSSIPGLATVDNSDRIMFPVLESMRILEFSRRKVAFFVGKLCNQSGERSECDPRAVLEAVLEKAEREYGVRFIVGPEHEFFLLKGNEFNDDIHTDSDGYFGSSPGNEGEVVRQKIVDLLGKCGINYEKTHHEVTPSQHEINLEPGNPLDIADRTLLFTHVTKEIAAEYGMHATFMSKPFDKMNRNAFHIHTSMTDLDGKNLFYDSKADHNLSQEMRYFIGGILKYARESTIVLASTLNSYKAYIMDREAPIIRGWGLKNRSSMVRIPHAINPTSTRLELRCPDATGNVYLQFAILIAMGLKGLEEKLDCGSPDIGSTYKKSTRKRMYDKRFIPRDIFEALMEAEKSSFLKDVLGRSLFDNYMALKMEDWEEHRTHVTPREHHKYLSI
jgi:glutamine synthetase